MSLNSTDITNGVSISGSTNPFNTYIKTENAGIYDIQFSAQVDKTDGGTDDIVIWLRKNGIDLTDTATTLTLPTNNSKVVAAWNWFVTSANGDYYQIIWRSADTDLRLLAEPITVDHPGIPSVIVTANRVDQFLSNTGSFSGSFTGAFTGSFSGSGTITSASFASTASFAPLYLPLAGGTISGNVTVLGTASINTLIVNQIGYSSGSNQLGDASNDTQTLYGSVIIPTGSLTVTGSALITGSLIVTGSQSISGSITTNNDILLYSTSSRTSTIKFYGEYGSGGQPSYHTLAVDSGNEFTWTAFRGGNYSTTPLTLTGGSTWSIPGSMKIGSITTATINSNGSYTGAYATLTLTGGGYNDATNPSINFITWDAGSTTSRFQIHSRTNGGANGKIVAVPNNGNFIIGSSTDLLAKLAIKGSGATSATTTLLVQNSAATELFKIRDDGSTFFGTGSITYGPTSGPGAGLKISLVTSWGATYPVSIGNLNTLNGYTIGSINQGAGYGYILGASNIINVGNGFVLGVNNTQNTTNGNHIIIGANNTSDSYTNGQNASIIIGQSNSTNGFWGGGLFGSNLRYYANSQLAFGGNSNNVNFALSEIYFGNGVRNENFNGNSNNGHGPNISINTSQAYSGSSALDRNGGNITLRGGQGTGTGSAGDVIFTTAVTGSTGATYHSYTNRVWIKGHTGNVGIGTSTPSSSLHISGASSNVLLEIDSPAVNNILFVSGSGNVGIGTGIPTSRLTVSGAAGTNSAIYAYKSGSTVLDIQGSQGQLFSVTDALSGSLMSVNDVSGLPILEVFSDDRVVMGTYGAPALTVTGSTLRATGSLLGTASYATTALSASWAPTSPAFPFTGSALITGSLDVEGNIGVTGSINFSGFGGLYMNNKIIYIDTAQTSFIGYNVPGIQAYTPTQYYFQAGSGNYLFTSTGAVISSGSAISPSKLLYLYDNVSTDATLKLEHVDPLAGSTTAEIGVSAFGGFSLNATSNSALTLGTNNTERARIDTTGNFGIGTIIPAQKLDVALGHITTYDSNTQEGKITFRDNASAVRWDHSSQKLHLTVSTRDKLTIETSAGYVGINQTSPSYQLDVSGSGNYSNGLTVTGSVIVSGSDITTAWTSYTPVWTAASSNPSIGNGTIEGYYKVIGKTCFVRGNIAMGSTTTFGSGEWYVSMPFTASNADAILMTAQLLDNGTAWYNATINGARAGFNYKTAIQYQATGGTANDVNATQPFTWTTSDRFLWNGSFEIA
jgi:hypothetical protein